MDEICICCTSSTSKLITMKKCKHAAFLKTYIKIKIPRQANICVICHNMLKKIETFKQQVEDSLEILSEKTSTLSINKLHNLNSIILHTIDSTILNSDPLELENKLKTEFENMNSIEASDIVNSDTQITKTEVNDTVDKEFNGIEFNDVRIDIKVDHETSDTECDAPVFVVKRGRKKRYLDKYEGKVNILRLSLDDVNVEREELAKEEKYMKLPYKCEYCIVGFDHEQTYKNHMAKRHTKDVKNKKAKDGAKDSAKDILERKRLAALERRKRIKNDPVLYQQAKEKEKDRYKRRRLQKKLLPICEMPAKDMKKAQQRNRENFRAYYKRKKLQLEIIEYQCIQCGKKYNHDHSAMEHYDDNHSTEGTSPLRSYVCRHCGFTTNRCRTYRYHLDKHKKKLECEICGNTFVTTTSLKKHLFTVHEQSSRVYSCTLCSKTYRADSGLAAHMRTAHAPPAHAYCALCRTYYVTEHALRVHQATHSRHIQDTDKRYICDDCGAKFVRKSSLLIHINWEHLKISPHNCSKCSKVFKAKKCLLRHIKYVHEKHQQPRNKICHICGRGFTTQSILESHIRTHTGERPLQCQHCKASFGHSGALYTHVRLKHNGSKK